MSLVILLWAVTAVAVLVGRIRRASWKTVRRYQAGQRAMARLGPQYTREDTREDTREHTTGDNHNEPRRPDANDVDAVGEGPSAGGRGGRPDDDVVPHVRLIESGRLPTPRTAFRGEPYTPIGRPGWARMADDLDRRPSVSIDSRAWARQPDGVPEQQASPTAGPSPAHGRGSQPDSSTIAALIRVAGSRPRRTRPRLTARHGPSRLARSRSRPASRSSPC